MGTGLGVREGVSGTRGEGTGHLGAMGTGHLGTMGTGHLCAMGTGHLEPFFGVLGQGTGAEGGLTLAPGLGGL